MAAKEKIHKGQVREHTRARIGSPPIHVHNLLNKAPASVQRDKDLIDAVIDNPEFSNISGQATERAAQTRLGKQVTRANIAVEAAVDRMKDLLGKESMDKEALSAWKKRLLEGTLDSKSVGRLLEENVPNRRSIPSEEWHSKFEALNKIRTQQGKKELPIVDFYRQHGRLNHPETWAAQSPARLAEEFSSPPQGPLGKLDDSLSKELEGQLRKKDLPIGNISNIETPRAAAERLHGSKGNLRGPSLAPDVTMTGTQREFIEQLPEGKLTPEKAQKIQKYLSDSQDLRQEAFNLRDARLTPLQERLMTARGVFKGNTFSDSPKQLRKDIGEHKRTMALTEGYTGKRSGIGDIASDARIPRNFQDALKDDRDVHRAAYLHMGATGKHPGLGEIAPSLGVTKDVPKGLRVRNAPEPEVVAPKAAPEDVSADVSAPMKQEAPKKENRLLRQLGIGAAVGVPLIAGGAYGLHRLRNRESE